MSSLPRLFAFLCILVLSACVPKQQATRALNPGEAEVAWHAFAARAAASRDDPFRVEASLRYSGPDISGARVSALLWGNGKSDAPYPLRLDLTAGLGTVVAKVREDGQAFVAYSPQEKSAYFHTRGNRTLVSFGVPIPLTMADLSLILTGRCGMLFLPTDATQTKAPQVVGVTPGGVRFAVADAPLAGILEISANGAPLSWKEDRQDGWTIAFQSEQTAPLRPTKLTITHPSGYEAVITVKELALLREPFAARQLDLVLPPGTEQKALADAGRQ